jgi:hypothetical protein
MTTRTRFLAACLVLVVLAWTAACSKSAGSNGVASVSGTATPSATPSLSLLEQGIRYAQCMRQHGVPMPDPVANGNGIHLRGVDKDAVDADVLSRAEQVCQQYRPVLSASDRAQKVEKALQYSQCMRGHGVQNYPDPDSSGGVQLDPSVNQDPQYDKAKTICDAQSRSSRPSS